MSLRAGTVVFHSISILLSLISSCHSQERRHGNAAVWCEWRQTN